MIIPYRRVVAIAAALVIPVLLQSTFVVLLHGLNERLMPYKAGEAKTNLMIAMGFASFAISSVAGFVFLFREFRQQSLYIAIAYFPIVCGFLMLLSLGIAGRVYGEYL